VAAQPQYRVRKQDAVHLLRGGRRRVGGEPKTAIQHSVHTANKVLILAGKFTIIINVYAVFFYSK
jgi:hypothetical protein